MALVLASTFCSSIFPCTSVVANAADQVTAATLAADNEQTLSYGELAELKIRSLFEAVSDDLEKIDDETLPHEAKAVRKDLAKLREMFDVFVFAFPADRKDEGFLHGKGHGGEEDPWVTTRKTLDEGYEIIGHFKDLFDAQGLTIVSEETPVELIKDGDVRASEIRYDDKLSRRQRKEVLEWLADFSSDDFQADVNALIRGIKHDTFVSHSRKELSKFSWGGVNARPKEKETGFETLRRLVGAHAHEAKNELSSLLDIKNPADSEKQEIEFHNYRKRLRSLARIPEMFSGLVPEPEIVADLNAVRKRVDDFGAIEDQIVAMRLAIEKRQNGKAKRIARDVDKEWDNLHDDLRQSDFKVTLERIAEFL